MTRHLTAVPEPPAGPAHTSSSRDRPAAREDERFIHRALAASLARVQPEAEQIAVERLERDDGTLIVYLSTTDVAAFIYTAPTPGAGGDTDIGAVVFDVHRRTDTAQHRLQFLLDNGPARLLAWEATQFQVAPSTSSPHHHLTLACLRCQTSVPIEPPGLLHALLEAAADHSCPADPAATDGADPCN